jgi:hypothetical protein
MPLQTFARAPEATSRTMVSMMIGMPCQRSCVEFRFAFTTYLLAARLQ